MAFLLPAELCELRQWVVAGPRKMPMVAGERRPASSVDPRTWRWFHEAAADGRPVGFVLTAADPYAVVDLDAASRPQHDEILDRFPGTYAETSQSGAGLHIWTRAVVGAGRRRGGVELYDRARYMICTGQSVCNWHEIVGCQPSVDRLMAALASQPALDRPPLADGALTDARQVTELACNASAVAWYLREGRWRELGYPSQSEADLSLMGHFMRAGATDGAARAAFLESALGRRGKAQRADYMSQLLRKARG